MILLDTNVVSALMRLGLEPRVQVWFNVQVVEKLVLLAPTIFELRHGIELKTHDKQRRALEAAFDVVIKVTLGNRVISLETVSAAAAGKLYAAQHKRSQNVAVADRLIGGIALANGLILATRKMRDFAGAGIQLVDLWA